MKTFLKILAIIFGLGSMMMLSKGKLNIGGFFLSLIFAYFGWKPQKSALEKSNKRVILIFIKYAFSIFLSGIICVLLIPLFKTANHNGIFKIDDAPGLVIIFFVLIFVFVWIIENNNFLDYFNKFESKLGEKIILKSDMIWKEETTSDLLIFHSKGNIGEYTRINNNDEIKGNFEFTDGKSKLMLKEKEIESYKVFKSAETMILKNIVSNETLSFKKQ